MLDEIVLFSQVCIYNFTNTVNGTMFEKIIIVIIMIITYNVVVLSEIFVVGLLLYKILLLRYSHSSWYFNMYSVNIVLKHVVTVFHSQIFLILVKALQRLLICRSIFQLSHIVNSLLSLKGARNCRFTSLTCSAQVCSF